MLNVKNISTGEVKVVYRVHFNNANNVFTFEGVPSEKVLAKMEGIFTYDGNNDERGNAVLTISPNWEKATKTNNANKTNNEPKAKKAVKKSAKVATNDTTATGTTNEPEPKNEPTNEPKPEPKKKAAKVKTNKATAKVEKVATIDEPKNDTGANDDAKALLDILSRIKGGNIDAEAVRELVRATIDEMIERPKGLTDDEYQRLALMDSDLKDILGI